MTFTQEYQKQLYTPTFSLLCLSQFLFAASFSMIVPELPEHLRSLGGEEYIGLIIGLFTLTAGISRPFSGKLTDTIGRMPVQIIGTLVCVFASFLYPFFSSVFGILLIRLFHGFSTGFKPTATSAHLADIVPIHRRGEAMGIMGVSMNAGASISPPLGSYLATTYSLDTMFYTSSGIAIVSVLILLGMKETLQKKQKFNMSHLRIGWSDIVDKTAVPPAILAFFIYMSIGVCLTICPDQSAYFGMENKGLFLTSYTLCSVLSRLISGRMSDRYGRVNVLIISLIMIALSLLYFNFINSPATLLIGTGILGFAVGTASPAVFAWTIDRCQDENRGRALATIFIALEISIGLGAIGSAWIYDSNPLNFGLTFLILSAVTWVGVVYISMWKRFKKN